MKNNKTRASAKTDAPPSGAESSNQYPKKTRGGGAAPPNTRKRNLTRFAAQNRKPTHEMVGVSIADLRASYYTQATLWPLTTDDESVPRINNP